MNRETANYFVAIHLSVQQLPSKIGFIEKKTYTLTDGITRDYMNFEKAGSEDELHDIFTIKDCKSLISDKTVTLAYKFECEGDSCVEFMKKRVYDLKRSLVDFILSKKISPLRIDNVQYNINGAQLEVEVTFLDSPNLQYIFNSETKSVSADTFRKMEKIEATSEYECLDQLSRVQNDIDVAIYRPSDFSCGYLTNFEDLKEDTKSGQPCSVYHFPLNNLQRIDQEIPLDSIHDAFRQYFGFSISYYSGNSHAATEYDGECNVYLPKVSEKYQKTGNKIVSDVLYTEMNLNFEQCASLCHGWSDGETGCKSFDYCPKSKTESSCSLNQFSVESSNTKTIEGGDCSNYELKVESNGKKRKESSSTEAMKGTSGSGAFEIIMLFFFHGVLLGFTAPFGYTNAKQLRNITSGTNESFSWTRQVNEQAENINQIVVSDSFRLLRILVSTLFTRVHICIALSLQNCAITVILTI